MSIVDTNVLLRAVLLDDAEQSRVAQAFLKNAGVIVISLQTFCEFVWVTSRSYRIGIDRVSAAVSTLIADKRVVCDRDAVRSGLEFLSAGGDFADGVIAFDGRSLGGRTFVTFDRRAASTVTKTGGECLLLGDD